MNVYYYWNLIRIRVSLCYHTQKYIQRALLPHTADNEINIGIQFFHIANTVLLKALLLLMIKFKQHRKETEEFLPSLPKMK